MVKPEVRERLDEGALVFDNPAYDESIIGQTFDGRAIYDIDKMADELAADDGISLEEAADLLVIMQSDRYHMLERRLR